MLEYALQPLSMLIKGIFGNRGNFDTAFNLGADIESQIYNRSLQDRLFKRDDNAIQRMAYDYEAAGFNPLLAAGGTGAANTKAFESSGSQVDTLAKKYQESEIDNLAKQKEYLDAQINDLKNQSNRNRQLDEAKIRKNKYFAKLLGIKDAPYGIDFNDYSVKDIALLRAFDVGEDTLTNILTSDNAEEEDKTYALYRNQRFKYDGLKDKEKARIDQTLQYEKEGVQKVANQYDNDGKIYMSKKNGGATAYYVTYTRHGIKLNNGNETKVFYNDSDYYKWLNAQGYKPIK